MERNEKGQFKKGSTMTAEELVKKSRSLSVSWRSRADYIGDIKDTHPRIYNSWRSIRFTQKGKAAGCDERWADFRTFYNDVEPSYQKGLVLRRKDVAVPWGVDNFMWVSPGESGVATTRIMLTYNGETLSLKQWAEKVQSSFSAIKLRYYRHKEYSVEEVIFGKKTKRGSKTVKDERDRIRAKASKMISSYKAKDGKNGFEVCDIDIDWMIEHIITKPCHYCGDTHRVGCDRIDNSRGHTKDNVVPCCIECNTAKNNYFTYDEMRVLGRAIAGIKMARGIDLNENLSINYSKWASRDTEYRRKMTMHKTYQFDLSGNLFAEYDSVNDAAAAVGVTPKTISAACCGKQHGGHICKGYVWSHDNGKIV